MSQNLSKPSTAIQSDKSLHVNFDKDITLEGVNNILQSNDKEIVLTMGDNTLVLSGENFNIDVFDLTKRFAQISGKLYCVKYSKGREKLSFLKRIIK